MKYIILLTVVLLASCMKMQVKKGSRVTLAYKISDNKGAIIDKTVFDDNFNDLEHNELFAFTVGNKEVIYGWDSVILGCRKNILYHFEIPYEHAYSAESLYHDLPSENNLKITFKIISIE